MSINRWMDKENVVYLYHGILLSNKNNVICRKIDELRGYHTKWNKVERKRQISLQYHLHVESKKRKYSNELISKTEKDS